MNHNPISQSSAQIVLDKSNEVPKYVDAVKADEQTLQELLKGDLPIKFDWANKWLKGEEYAHILSRMDAYCKAFDFQKFHPKMHPDSIYI